VAELAPDLMAVNTRFRAHPTVVSPLAPALAALNERIQELHKLPRHHDSVRPGITSKDDDRIVSLAQERVDAALTTTLAAAVESAARSADTHALSSLHRQPHGDDVKDMAVATERLWNALALFSKRQEHRAGRTETDLSHSTAVILPAEAAAIKSDVRKRLSQGDAPSVAAVPAKDVEPLAAEDREVRGRGWMDPATLLTAVGDHWLRAGDVVCIDTGDVTLWASLCLKLPAGVVTLSSERLGTMGYGVPAGIAASLLMQRAQRQQGRVVVIVGDGGFQMTLQELATAVEHDCSIVIIVLDNGLSKAEEYILQKFAHSHRTRLVYALVGLFARVARQTGSGGVRFRRCQRLQTGRSRLAGPRSRVRGGRCLGVCRKIWWRQCSQC